MLIQFTPKQIAEQWNDLWPLIKEGLPLSYMREGDGTGILAGLLRNELQAFGIVEDGQTLSLNNSLVILLTAMQVDKFASVALLYVYSYSEVKACPVALLKDLAGSLLEVTKKTGASYLVLPCNIGSLEQRLPQGEVFKWHSYVVKEE